MINSDEEETAQNQVFRFTAEVNFLNDEAGYVPSSCTLSQDKYTEFKLTISRASSHDIFLKEVIFKKSNLIKLETAAAESKNSHPSQPLNSATEPNHSAAAKIPPSSQSSLESVEKFQKILINSISTPTVFIVVKLSTVESNNSSLINPEINKLNLENISDNLKLALATPGDNPANDSSKHNSASSSTNSDYSNFMNFIEKSNFIKRTDEFSAQQYFQFYSLLSQQQNMMQDYVRTGTYQQAMLQNSHLFKDKIVMDCGAGSAILSFFAIQAGAKKVYAVEASNIAKFAAKLVDNSPYKNRIVILPGKLEEVEIPKMLEDGANLEIGESTADQTESGLVDILISEPMGYMLYNERMLESYVHAKKFLKNNGLMFPSIGDTYCAPFNNEPLYWRWF